MDIYKLSIKTPGRMLQINHKLSRTPLTFVGTMEQINKIKSKFKVECITDYTIEEYVEPKVIKNPRHISKQNQEQNNNEDNIEFNTHKTILESFLDD